MTPAAFYIATPNVVVADALTNVATSAYNNSASVQARLTTVDGTSVISATALSYVASSNGKYRGTLAAPATPLTEGQKYLLIIELADGTRLSTTPVKATYYDGAQ